MKHSTDHSTLLHKGNSTLIYRTTIDDDDDKNDNVNLERSGTSVAVKVLTDPSELQYFNNEYNILKSLPLSNGTGFRRVLKKGKFNGMDAMYLEWVDGISLQDWLKKRETQDRSQLSTEDNDNASNLGNKSCFKSDILNMIKIIRCIASSLASIHEAGIVHNDITPGNIIIKDDGNEMVSIIDFGFASKDIQIEMDDEGNRAHDDMPALASLVRKIFKSIQRNNRSLQVNDLLKRCDEENEIPFSSSSIFSSPPNMESSLVEEDSYMISRELPSSIFRILRDLKMEKHKKFSSNATDGGSLVCHNSTLNLFYRSSRELEEDLIQMVEDPETFLFDPHSPSQMKMKKATSYNDSSVFKQRHPKVLHGLIEETKTLLELGNNIVDDISSNKRTDVVVVCGPSGTGKTSLIHKLQESLKQHSRYFVMGKFDQLQCAKPYSALVVAFNELCDFILEGDSDQSDIIRENIKSALGSNGKVLTDVIPHLTNIIGEQPPVPELGALETQNRFKHAIQSFMYSICELSSCPIVLVLDDIQWADKPSIELIETIVSHKRTPHFLFVGCYRDDEVTPDHQVTMSLKKMEGKGVSINKIELKNMEKKAVTNLLSERLRLTRRYTRSLGDIVHKKTLGNALFVSQFLLSLCNDGILYYCQKEMRWVWDEVAVDEKKLSDNVVELMSSKIMALKNEQQKVLMTMSCVGSYFDKSIFLSLFPEYHDNKRTDNGEEFANEIMILRSLIDEGLVDKMRTKNQYKFSHDRIQQAAYSLFSTKRERDEWHVRIGRYFIKRHSEFKEPSSLFAATDHLNKGMEEKCETADKHDIFQLALFNAKAAKKAMMTSAFIPAKKYAMKGLDLLKNENDKFWETNYDLTLKLHQILVEADYCIGSFNSKTRCFADEVFENAKHYHDKVPVYSNLILSLSTQQGRAQEALEIGLDVLKNLGEPLPKSPSLLNVMIEFMKTKRMLKGKTNKYFCTLPKVTDKGKLYVMQTMTQVSNIAYVVNATSITALCCFRSVQLSLRYGLTKYVSYFLSSYAFMLILVLGDYKGAYRFAELSETLLNILDAKDQIVKVYVLLYCFIFCWRDHLRCSLSPLMEAYHIGLESGENEFAIYSANTHSQHALWSGKELGTLLERLETFCQKSKDVGQNVIYVFMLANLQIVQSLIGESKDEFHTGGAVAIEDELLKELVSSDHKANAYNARLLLSFISYIFGNYEEAAEYSKMVEDFASVFPGSLQVSVQVFYDGLISFALARQTNQKKWMRRGRKKMKIVKKWAKVSPENFTHKFLLLKAENASTDVRKEKKIKKAEVAFAKLLPASEESGYTHDAALAYERASEFYSAIGKGDLSSSSMARSRDLYLKWGAKEKVVKMTSTAQRSNLKEVSKFGSLATLVEN